MPEKTAAELREDGFFITGDLGRRDADGYVSIVGRDKDLIISGGYNIYPKEVELLLDDQPGVLESAVFGVPHPDFGESVVAVLVARRGAELDLAQIAGDVAGSLAKFKRAYKCHMEFHTDKKYKWTSDYFPFKSLGYVVSEDNICKNCGQIARASPKCCDKYHSGNRKKVTTIHNMRIKDKSSRELGCPVSAE